MLDWDGLTWGRVQKTGEQERSQVEGIWKFLFFCSYFRGTVCVSYQVVAVQGKTPSLPSGKRMVEKTLFLCKRNPKIFTLHGPSWRVVSSHTLALQDVPVRKNTLSSPS